MRALPLSCVSVLVLAACSGDPFPTDPSSNGGSTSSGAGGATSGGAAPATGGTSGGALTTSGGAPTSGGMSVTSGGSAVGTLGGASFGGATFGGSTFGGATSGGSTFGGSSFGGTGTSGANSGGRFGSNGGTSSGGVSSGGASSGGAGGSSTGTVTYAALCASCHGAKGEGITGKAPEIQHPVRDFSTWVVRNGRMGHPSFPGQVMMAYPAAVIPDATLTTFFDALSTPTIPKPTTGAALYADYCGTCHGAGGTGGPAGHNAKGQPLSKALSMVRSGHSLGQFSVRNGYMPKWTTTELTDAEVGLIVTYLDGL